MSTLCILTYDQKLSLHGRCSRTPVDICQLWHQLRAELECNGDMQQRLESQFARGS